MPDASHVRHFFLSYRMDYAAKTIRVLIFPVLILSALVACEQATTTTAQPTTPTTPEPTPAPEIAKIINLRISNDDTESARLASQHGVTSYGPKQLSFPSSFTAYPSAAMRCHGGLPTRYCWRVRITDLQITSEEIRTGGIIANARIANRVFSPPSLSPEIDLHIEYEAGENDASNATVILTLDADGLIPGSGSVRGIVSRANAERRIRQILNNYLLVRITVVK